MTEEDVVNLRNLILALSAFPILPLAFLKTSRTTDALLGSCSGFFASRCLAYRLRRAGVGHQLAGVPG